MSSRAGCKAKAIWLNEAAAYPYVAMRPDSESLQVVLVQAENVLLMTKWRKSIQRKCMCLYTWRISEEVWHKESDGRREEFGRNQKATTSYMKIPLKRSARETTTTPLSISLACLVNDLQSLSSTEQYVTASNNSSIYHEITAMI